jgi:hypothetical protein
MPTVAYILAASHSGSTLLAMLLNAHPEVCSIGELQLGNLDGGEQYPCSCGCLIKACPFWQRVSSAITSRGIPFDVMAARTSYTSGATAYTRRLLKPLLRPPLLEGMRDLALGLSPQWQRQIGSFRQRNLALVESLCEISGARVIVDSSKSGLRLKYLRTIAGLDVKVIRLIRDGRAVALTYTDPANYADTTNPALRGGGTGGGRERERLAIASAAQEWRRSNEEAENALRDLDPSQWIAVHYEELCTDTPAELSRIFTFLGLEPQRAAGDFRAVEHHVVGNGMRLDTTSEVRLDDRWRSALSAEDLRQFDAVAGGLNRHYGYS